MHIKNKLRGVVNGYVKIAINTISKKGHSYCSIPHRVMESEHIKTFFGW